MGLPKREAMTTYPSSPWGEVGDRLFHVTIDRQDTGEIQENCDYYSLAYFHHAINCQIRNSRQFPREQPILSHHGGLHGRSVHVFVLIHHSVGDLSLQETSGPQATTGKLDYET
jgi:hypothetical protein